MTMPQHKWTQQSAMTVDESRAAIATILGVPTSSVKTWVIVAHVHDNEMHANLVASSISDEATIDLLGQGMLAL